MVDFKKIRTSTVVVIDTEFTSWPGSHENGWSREGEYREIVQIGAVKLDPHNGLRETDCYEGLVKPKLNPQLSDYFIELTGITQQRIDRHGLPFPEMLAAFEQFCSDADCVVSNGAESKVIAENCSWHDVRMTEQTYYNLSKSFSQALGENRHVVSGTLCERFGLPSQGACHDALTDARCIAGALRALCEQT